MSRTKKIAWSVIRAGLLFACRHSWQVYTASNIVIEDRGVRIPVGRGLGLDMIGEKSDFSELIEWVYSWRSGPFVDVGANIGRVLTALLRYDRSIPYIGFEPSIKAAYSVSQIINENGLSATHRIMPVGLSDKTGYATLFSNGDADVSATINVKTRPASVYRFNTVISLGVGDDYLVDESAVAVLKIDAEGAEVSVLRGLCCTIDRHKPVIFIEILPIVELEHNTYSREAMGDLSEETRLQLIADRRLHASSIRDSLGLYGYAICKLRQRRLVTDVDVMQSSYADYDFVCVHRSLLPDLS
jgi:FkbM family methyltransferase